MKCADPSCRKRATRTLHGIPMCEDYYIEAIEHSAHILALDYVRELSKAARTDRERRDKVSEMNEEKRSARFITFEQWTQQEKSPNPEANPAK